MPLLSAFFQHLAHTKTTTTKFFKNVTFRVLDATPSLFLIPLFFLPGEESFHFVNLPSSVSNFQNGGLSLVTRSMA